MRRTRSPLLLAAALAGALSPVAAGPALARVSFSFGLGTTFYPAPWTYVPPPPPPPVYYYYAPPPPPLLYGAPPYGGAYAPPIAPIGPSCRAGAWTCPLGAPAPVGEACSCPTPQGPAWGRVGG
jgi:hypothetical protein